MSKRLVLIAFVIASAAGAGYFWYFHYGSAGRVGVLNDEPIEALRISAVPSSPTGNAIDFRHGTHADESACTLPATAAVTKAATPTIYHWTDEHGVPHYGDRPPVATDAAIYRPQLPSRLEYFNLEIEYRGEINTPHFRNQLTPQVHGIFQIFGEMTGQDRLRKIDLNIALYPDRNSYLRFAQSVAGRNMGNTGGFYSSGINTAATYVRANPEETLEVAKHESTHVIVTGVLGLAPVWLHEGLSEYFSLISIVGMSKQVSANPGSLALARQSRAHGYPRNLVALLSLDSTAWRGAWQSNNYAASWALVYFLMSSKEGKATLGNLMQQHADHYCQPMDSIAVLEASYPGGLGQLQNDFYRWLGDGESKRPHYY